MFRQLARWLQDQASTAGVRQDQQTEAALTVFLFHPLQLARFLEEAWAVRDNQANQRPNFALDDPNLPPPLTKRALAAAGRPSAILPTLNSFLQNWVPHAPATIYWTRHKNTGTWHHLIYAYILENTRMIEIVRQVLHEYAHGERLAVPSLNGQHWLRATEDLFYKDAPPFTIQSLTSHVRPDIAASRRNAYFRMFGMDLVHGSKDGGAYSYTKPEAFNRDFVPTFEALLREVWRGVENLNNQTGPNPTDDTAIATLAVRLSNMLRSRRQNGNLSREEFFYVCTMSWMHLTVEFNSPIVVDLKAEATSPEERLRKIGERVGVPAHGKSESYFRMAEPLARILTSLERGVFNSEEGAQTLYIPDPSVTPPAPPSPQQDMQTIITHWSLATGRDMKAQPVRVTGPTGTAVDGQAAATALTRPSSSGATP